MGRSSCCDNKMGLKKGPWTPDEDNKLSSYIQQHGHASWRSLPPKAGLRRCGKSCRLRWINYLRPDIKRGKFSMQEEQTIIQLHALLGNRWSAIASHLAKRTDNEIKNYWNTHLKKRLAKMGIDPTTHKPITHALIGQPRKDLSHMAQWETARLQAEARIVRESKLALSNPNYSRYHNSQLLTNKAAAPPPPPPPARPPCLDILKVWQGMMTWTNPRKDIVINSFFASDQNMLMTTNYPNVGLIHETAVDKTSDDYDQVKGIMENSSLLTDLLEDDLIPPSIARDNAAIGHGDDFVFFEDDNKVNYWSNILNVVSSPSMDSPMF